VSAVEIRGLDALRRRYAAASAPQPIKTALRTEAEAIAEEARGQAPDKLGQTIEVVDDSRGKRSAYAIGSSHPAARFLEFGTVHRPATPWLWPVFRARSRGVKHKLRKAVAAVFNSPRREI
jgi:HK97 gp10 family phage protein